MTDAVAASTVVPRRTAHSATSTRPAGSRLRPTDRSPLQPAVSATGVPTLTRGGGSPADRFERLRDRVHGLLPAGLRRFVPATAVGFAALSSFTYAVDLLILALLFDVVGAPYPFAVSIGYVTAFSLAFVLNRTLNFRSHGSVGRQTGRYVVTVVANYLLFILLLSTTLEALGVQYLLARLLAGACEAVFMYVMMRLFVFGQTRTGLAR